WNKFEAAHIFPLGNEHVWNQCGYGRRITDMDDSVGVSKINGIQNGFLLRSGCTSIIRPILLSVNPDDNYKVIVFEQDDLGVDGRMLEGVCRDDGDPHHVSDELLSWHFRQSVLANMRRAGQLTFEHDFVGKDMVKEMVKGHQKSHSHQT
ncbi:hypothetical protein EV426DRAFT_541599, partial [Tirmania nivea]